MIRCGRTVPLSAISAALFATSLGSGEPPVHATAEGIRLTRTSATSAQLSPRERIKPTVGLTVTYDPVSRMHEYEFTLTNAKDAQNSIAVFGIADVEPPDSAGAPPEWMAGYGWEGHQKAFVWAVADTLTPPPPGHVGINVYPSPFEVQPGQSMSGFWFKTRVPPTSFTFYAQGFDTILWTTNDYPDLFSIGVSGNIAVKGMAKNRRAEDRKQQR